MFWLLSGGAWSNISTLKQKREKLISESMSLKESKASDSSVELSKKAKDYWREFKSGAVTL